MMLLTRVIKQLDLSLKVKLERVFERNHPSNLVLIGSVVKKFKHVELMAHNTTVAKTHYGQEMNTNTGRQTKAVVSFFLSITYKNWKKVKTKLGLASACLYIMES